MSAIDFNKMRQQMRADAAAKRAAAKAASSPTAAAAAAVARVERQQQQQQWPASQTLTEAQRVGNIATVHYVADWISVAAAEALLQQLPADDPGWTPLTNRRLLNCGGIPHPSGMYAEALPAWCDTVSERLVTTGAFGASAPPNQVLLNEYDVTADGSGGGIAPHNDGPLFDANVAILTLGTPALLHFWERHPADPGANGWGSVEGRDPVCSVLLEPRSLLVFSDLAYTVSTHHVCCAACRIIINYSHLMHWVQCIY